MKESSLEEHKVCHRKLHTYLDELIADFIIHVGRLPSEVTVLELMEWSDKQITQPSVVKVELLSNREIEVLCLLVQGLTNKDIAQTLILSVRTVEVHLHNIFGKLDVHSRTEAVLWAVNHGYG